MVDGHWKRLATSSVLLGVMVLVAGGLLALIGSTVFPQAQLFVWAAVVLLVFLLVQLAMFRILGLRSRADESSTPTRPARTEAEPARHVDRNEIDHSRPVAGSAEAEPEVAEDRDWRAWRG